MLFQKPGVQLIEILPNQEININSVKLTILKGTENIKELRIHAHVGNEVTQFYCGEFKDEVMIDNANTKHLMIEIEVEGDKNMLGIQHIRLCFW